MLLKYSCLTPRINIFLFFFNRYSTDPVQVAVGRLEVALPLLLRALRIRHVDVIDGDVAVVTVKPFRLEEQGVVHVLCVELKVSVVPSKGIFDFK